MTAILPNNAEKVLLVDDDPNILAAMQRQFRDRFALTVATGGVEALRVISEKGPFAVIVSDLQMPDLDGLRFLAKARQQVPTAVPMILSGNADLGMAIAALNEGRVFRFLTKPCPGDVLEAAISAALQKYRADEAEKALIEHNLGGDVIAALRKVHAQAEEANVSLAKLLTENEKKEPTPAITQIDELDGPKFAFHQNYSGGVIDPATNLPDWKTADTALRAAFTAPNPPYLAVFYVQRVDFANTRYGTSVGNHILLTASQFLASQMSDAPFFRWKGPVLLALIGASETPSTVRSSLQHLVAATRPEYFQTATRSVFLRVKIEFGLMEGEGASPDDAFRYIDQFSKRLKGT